MAAALLWAVAGPPAVRAEQGVIAGIDAAAAIPLGSFKNRAETGGSGSLFGGYMFNDYIGVAAQAQYSGFFSVNRHHKLDEGAQALGLHVGPRAALPFDIGSLPAELYATWQGGLYTGLVGDTPISRTSWGFSTGAGLNFRLTRTLLIGPFGRYNWLDQRVEPGNDVQFVTVGLGVTYNALPEPAVEEAPPPPPPPPPPTVKKKIILRGVNFDFNKATIRPDARPVLDRAVATLREEGGIAVIAEGHTDSIGSDEYNRELSERRAQAVRDYMVDGGVAPSRITFEGQGESRPVASNDTADGRAQNRRVELKIRSDDN